jgi:ABC-type bacteriocin/lantibiotic exporter with double-glycine peptidase domain
MLPVMQLAYASLTSIQGGQASLRDTLDLLDQSLPDYVNQTDTAPLNFHRHISLNNLSFRYSPKTPWVLKNLDIEIAKGSRIGFIGTTGSGKSTLLDILMGLLTPTEGILMVDGHSIKSTNLRAWQAHISHVPQAIFLADSTIEENIAFGNPKSEIDRHRVIKAAQQAQIADLIESWPDQYETMVGERGVRLSGGQRQRIGIARALYKKADVIIFDEATSALDSDTEQAVMDAIESLGAEITILIIAHRLTTLKKCTHVIEICDGGVRRSGSYQELIAQVA